ALANPALHLTLRHNGKLVYDIPASAGLLDRIGLFFTREVRDALDELDSGPELSAASADPARPPGRVSGLRLTGYIADPKCDRGNAKLQYLFVNGRWFRDRSIGHALQEAYRGLLMTGRYAVGFVFITLPPDKVDVNVHPTKAEVRFQENSLVYSLVRSAVKTRLLKENLVPRLTVPVGQDPSEFRDQSSENRDQTDNPGLFPSPRADLARRTIAPWERFQANPDREGGGGLSNLPALTRPSFNTPTPAPHPVA